MAEPVVGRTLLRILEELVGLVDFLELAFGLGVARVLVGMVFHGKLAESALEFLLVGTPRHTKRFIEVWLGHCIHYLFSGAFIDCTMRQPERRRHLLIEAADMRRQLIPDPM